MPCYSYSSNNSILINNIEVVFNASGTTYSYDSIYYICDLPISNQIKVYTRAGVGQTETLKVENLDYTFVGTNIVFTTAPAGQIVIRRSTNDQKMLTVFSDGAKLSANELNAAMHQLLFLVQEKELAGSEYNYVYTEPSSLPAWSIATAYQPNAVVYYSTNGNVYRCILATTAGIVPTNATYWTLVNASSLNFLALGGPNPVIFDFENLDPGATLSWTGTKFVASDGVSTDLGSISDVNIISPQNKQVLAYNNSNNKWENKTTLFNIFDSPLIFPERPFHNVSTNFSYTTTGTNGIDVGSTLDLFKNGNGNWVLTDPPTVYHILQTTIPTNQTNPDLVLDPRNYFASIETRFLNIGSNIANPVKVKFIWNLNENRSNIVDSSNDDCLDNHKSMYWNSPEELYSTDGYYSGGGTLMTSHGVLSGSTTYKVSPYFTSITTGGSTTYTTKLHGYGVKSFYLSVPECATSNLSSIPIMNGTAFHNAGSLGSSDGTETTESQFLAGLNTILRTNQTPLQIDQIASNVKYMDFYLNGLRDFAFANPQDFSGGNQGEFFGSIHSGVEDTLQVAFPVRDRFARKKKSSQIWADYKGFRNISFKRLEGNETAADVLWKIPTQIIYYNRIALALASKTNTGEELSVETDGGTGTVNNPLTGTSGYQSREVPLSSTTDWNDLKKTIRWEGWSKPTTSTSSYTNSSTTSTITGRSFKADEVWIRWNEQWSSNFYNVGATKPYMFHHADIDWFLMSVAASGNGIGGPISFFAFNGQRSTPMFSATGVSGGTYAGAANPLTNSYGGNWFPWPYRPNDIRITSLQQPTTKTGLIGTHLLNIDANKLFSEASRFIPDPVDEYVFRLVCKSGLTSQFRDNIQAKLKTAIILEHGFASNSRFSDRTILTALNQVFQNNITGARSNYNKSRVDHSKIKVFVKNEAIEQIAGVNRLVVTIAIQVPRIKSIGYSRIFRAPSPQSFTGVTAVTTSVPPRDNTTVDSEIGGGPFNWDLEQYSYTNGTSAATYFNSGISSFTAGTATDWYNFTGYQAQFIEEFEGTPNTSGNPDVVRAHAKGAGPTPKTVFSEHNDGTAGRNIWTTQQKYSVSGRNECAVKFTNVGIPSDLWIRLSILNTDATLELLTLPGSTTDGNRGFNPTAVSEA
jgi:hypothetical protein